MSEKAPEQTTIQCEVLFPLANVRHKNTHSCVRQSQWKGRHHGGRENTEPERKTGRIWDCVCVSVCVWMERKCGMLWFSVSSGSGVAHRPKPQWCFWKKNSSTTCCNYALLLCCNNVDHIMCLLPHPHTAYLPWTASRVRCLMATSLEVTICSWCVWHAGSITCILLMEVNTQIICWHSSHKKEFQWTTTKMICIQMETILNKSHFFGAFDPWH